MSSDPIERRTIRPSDCTFVFGLPMDFDAFRRDLDSSDKHLVPKCYPYWIAYRQDVVEPGELLMEEARRLGAAVATDVSLERFGSVFDRSVVILVAHWVGESIELADAIHGIPEILEAIPPSFDGFVDLCICHPDSLALSIRERCGRAMVRYSPIESPTEIWFAYYRALLRILANFERTYPDATAELLSHFLMRSRV
jgi:hypothetical protein